MVAGGAASAKNAAHVNDDIDEIHCDELDSLPAVIQAYLEEMCEDAERIRDCQIASAVSSNI